MTDKTAYCITFMNENGFYFLMLRTWIQTSYKNPCPFKERAYCDIYVPDPDDTIIKCGKSETYFKIKRG